MSVVDYSQIVLQDNPFLYWRLNDPASSAQVADLGSGANPGTVNGTVTFQQAGAVPNGKSALFDGSTGYIQSVNAPSAYNGPITLEGWVNAPSAWSSGEGFIVSTNLSSANLFADFGWPYFQVYIGNNQVLIDQLVTMSLNTWYHLASVWDGTSACLYQNGVLIASQSAVGTFRGYAGYTSTGGAASGGGDFFKGLLAEIAVYQAALTPQQILNHYSGRTLYNYVQAPSFGAIASQYQVSYWTTETINGQLATVANCVGYNDLGRLIWNKVWVPLI